MYRVIKLIFLSTTKGDDRYPLERKAMIVFRNRAGEGVVESGHITQYILYIPCGSAVARRRLVLSVLTVKTVPALKIMQSTLTARKRSGE